MTTVLLTATESAALDAVVGPRGNRVTYRLPTNQAAPPASPTPADFVELAAPGYSARPGGDWSLPLADDIGQTLVRSPFMTTTRASGTNPAQTATYWYVTVATN